MMRPTNNTVYDTRYQMFIAVLMSTLTCVIAYLVYNSHSKPVLIGKGLVSEDLLRRSNGIDKPELYLSILGNVFDVTKGAKHYGPGQTYNMFIGRDNSKGFQTGKMHADDDDNISFEFADLKTLAYWIQFYKDQYISKGKLVGKYYDYNGNLTPYGEQVHLQLEKVKETEAKEENIKLIFPPCNIEWSPHSYTRVWCTKNSGGVKRDWAGFPRRLFDTEKQTERCACIGDSNRDLGMYEEYIECESDSPSCYTLMPV